MNMILIAKHLQFLCKKHHYTQDDLAKILNISRQAVSRWETGTTIPDLGILLKISQLYHITINEILEPEVHPKKITEFDQLAALPEKDLKKYWNNSM